MYCQCGLSIQFVDFLFQHLSFSRASICPVFLCFFWSFFSMFYHCNIETSADAQTKKNKCQQQKKCHYKSVCRDRSERVSVLFFFCSKNKKRMRTSTLLSVTSGCFNIQGKNHWIIATSWCVFYILFRRVEQSQRNQNHELKFFAAKCREVLHKTQFSSGHELPSTYRIQYTLFLCSCSL